jgi:hypothetical protein
MYGYSNGVSPPRRRPREILFLRIGLKPQERLNFIEARKQERAREVERKWGKWPVWETHTHERERRGLFSDLPIRGEEEDEDD